MSTEFTGQGSVMGVGGGIHDDAVDVTYSTKPDQPQAAFGQAGMATTTITTSTPNMVLVPKKIQDWD